MDAGGKPCPKALLALTHGGEDGPRIVAEIQDPENLEAARLVGKSRTTLLDIRETVAKLNGLLPPWLLRWTRRCHRAHR